MKPQRHSGPVSVTADHYKSFTRYRLNCACGWSTWEDSKDTSGAVYWMLIANHMARCDA
jgi:hypothetical protein